jgi:type IV secretory pathway VirB2 component (pilin)
MSSRQLIVFYLLVAVIIITIPHTSHALAIGGSAAGGAMPWDPPLANFATDLTGPTAFALSIFALFCAGAALVFGGELHHFVRSVCYAIMVVAFLTGATNGASALGFTGALVA